MVYIPEWGITEPGFYRARLRGIVNGMAAANSTATFDWKMEQLDWLGVNKSSYFDGVLYHAGGGNHGDTVTFQVVDRDGIVYPAGTVLEEFAKDWGVVPDTRDTIRLFKSSLVPNMYIRTLYTNTGGSAVHFICNLFRFIKTDEDA
jgi:hypothetical protein